MPEIINNTQAQENTTSNQGTNKMPKLDAKSFFFSEDEVFVQLANQAFGVVSEDVFRTTSLLTVNSKKIISICSGQVFLQPSNETGKVNLILKPYRQPVNGLSVKYFIYRGLPKDQFLDGSNQVLATGSGLITHIRTEFNSFYSQDASLSPAPVFLGKYIGYPDPSAPPDEVQHPEDLIDSYFYKISQTFTDETGTTVPSAKHSFELPMIPAGTHLATVTGVIGLEVVLNYGDYYIENDPNPFKLDLAFARLQSSVIDVSGITDAYQKKLMREAITQFIDPAAYYGLHANGGKISKFNVTQPLSSAADIAALIGNFTTKNNVYIYIQSNRQKSYNFYGKYKISDNNNNNIKIGISEAGLAENTFETSKWPVTVFNTAPATGSTQATIAYQFTTDRNPKTALYGVIANILSENDENFVDAQRLIKEASGPILPLTYFTTTVQLVSPIANNANIASFVRLLYVGKEIVLSRPDIDDGDPNTPTPALNFNPAYRDDIFDLVHAVSFLKANNIFHVHSYVPKLQDQADLDPNRGYVLGFTQRTENTIALSETENLTLFTYLSIAESEQSKHTSGQNVSSNKEASGYAVQNVTSVHTLPNLPTNEYIELKVITDVDQTVTTVKLVTKDGSLPTSMMLGITNTENDVLKALSSAPNQKLYFEPFSYTENVIKSAEGVLYQRFRLGLIVDKADFGQEMKMPADADKIIVYSTDGLLFYSKKYSDYIESIFDKEPLTSDESNKQID